ncbi:hypothetical protein MPH_12366 [Macrophomina phaseolina MS6]|uniref:Uncharacterized protein n=1 Tax=Macrophomina phaseolina (strain MS6) TaxID=1126212 RepID=K2R817_MACPH|nr:hypothetical protein MPH_12366 [Macrophomina phaseolina MS6]
MPRAAHGYTQGQYAFQQSLDPQPQHYIPSSPLSIPPSPSSAGMARFSLQPHVWQYNIPQQIQSLPPQLPPQEQQSLHTTNNAPRQSLAPERETGIGSDGVQSSQMHATLLMENAQPWQVDVSGTMPSTQDENDYMSAMNNHTADEFNPAPLSSATVSEST